MRTLVTLGCCVLLICPAIAYKNGTDDTIIITNIVTDDLPVVYESQRVLLHSQTYFVSVAINGDTLFLASPPDNVEIFRQDNNNNNTNFVWNASLSINREDAIPVHDLQMCSHEKTLAVGHRIEEPYTDDDGSLGGNVSNLVYMYVREEDAEEPTLKQILEIPPRDDLFVYALGTYSVIHGDTLVAEPTYINVVCDDSSCTYIYPSDGDLRIFERNSEGFWRESQQISIPQIQGIVSMGLFEDTLVVITSRGKAWNRVLIYTKDADSGEFQQRQQDISIRASHNRIAIYDDTFVVAGRSPDTGGVRIFERHSSTQIWRPVAWFRLAEGITFGNVVATYRDTIIVSTDVNQDQYMSGDRAELYVFTKSKDNYFMELQGKRGTNSSENGSSSSSSSTWELARKLVAGDNLPMWFSDIAMDHQNVAVVAHSSGLNARAYIFEYRDEGGPVRPTSASASSISTAQVCLVGVPLAFAIHFVSALLV